MKECNMRVGESFARWGQGTGEVVKMVVMWGLSVGMHERVLCWDGMGFVVVFFVVAFTLLFVYSS
jgi:hypothetical protein